MRQTDIRPPGSSVQERAAVIYPDQAYRLYLLAARMAMIGEADQEALVDLV